MTAVPSITRTAANLFIENHPALKKVDEIKGIIEAWSAKAKEMIGEDQKAALEMETFTLTLSVLSATVRKVHEEDRVILAKDEEETVQGIAWASLEEDDEVELAVLISAPWNMTNVTAGNFASKTLCKRVSGAGTACLLGCIKIDSEKDVYHSIYVQAARNAVPFYQKRNFKAVAGFEGSMKLSAKKAETLFSRA